ncbi:hypothetical protein HU200_047076 [Digitaria exilis]|uniref:Protein kinase domain-containing protein n=1 Tax=Digitaria exilis TaxID=1010633 RepID=A0A835EBW7_9POAL|nr:hypothetical protein HU200_047076 [Digitaria exilis]
MDVVAFKQLRRLRTLGRGASGAVVWLATDDASGQLLAVKSATGPAAAEQLQREARVLSALRSPHIVPCLGAAHHATGEEYHLFLEFAPRGSLADEAARNGGRLEERDIRRYAADVARGLAYLHGELVVHGDVKAANVVLEVARGEEQGAAADVWALACTVIEMATGAAPWSRDDTAGDVYATVHKIAYTDAVPEVPAWLSSEAKDFLCICLQRHPRRRPNTVELLDHPFIVSADEPAASKQQCWTSPKSTLDMAFWESDEDEEDSESAAGRIGSLASPRSAFPDWESEEEDDGWIDVHSCECSRGSEAPAADTVTAASAGFGLRMSEALDAVDVEVGLHVVDVEDAIRYPTTSHGVGVVEDFVKSQQRHSSSSLGGVELCLCPFACCQQGTTMDRNSVVLVMTNEKSSLIMHKFGHFVALSMTLSVQVVCTNCRLHSCSRCAMSRDKNVFFFQEKKLLLQKENLLTIRNITLS